MSLHIEAAGRTHVGLVRQRNEDRFHVGRTLLAVADGLGGHVAGDIASETAIAALTPYDVQVDIAELATTLGRAVRDANDAIRARAESEPALLGMGTTLVALLHSGNSAVLANVGDSRAYLLRDETLTQITEDHTYGHLIADAASVPELPDRLARYLDGRTDGRSPDLTVRELCPGDRFLLCSDGLTSYVPHDDITTALKSAHEPADAAQQLVTLSLDHGGHDNVTVIVADILSTHPRA